MKVSYKWLKNYLDFDLPPGKVAEILTNTGLEVEGIEDYSSIPGSLNKVVTGQIKKVESHPDADKLKVTQVDINTGGYLNIICGAPNVKEGQKVIVALVGSEITNAKGEHLKIKKAKIRGVRSEGMICAEDELGVGTDHSGILVLDPSTQVGIPAVDALRIYEDTIFEVAITPNRADAVSHVGVARDLAAAMNKKLSHPKDLFKEGKQPPGVKINIENPADCPRYSGLVIKGVKVGPSPGLIKNKLESLGLQPINNIVDITNYVLYEIGQPLHAFDLKEISGGEINVRRSRNGQKFLMLDEKERTLTGKELMIENVSEPIAMAGIMGGEDSGVHDQTKDIFIESACFNPSVVRKAASEHSINTDASFRFERGADPNATLKALKRAAQLILEIAGGEASAIIDEYLKEISPLTISLDSVYMKRILGIEIPLEKAAEILRGLEYGILEQGKNNLTVEVPTYRVDVTRPVDLVEEVIRVYGLDKVSFSEQIHSPVSRDPSRVKEKLRNKVAGLLKAKGFHEMINTPFSIEEYAEKYPELVEKGTPVKLINPMSKEQNLMRFNMIFSGLETVRYNIHRRNSDLKLFEMGKVFWEEKQKFGEKEVLSVFLTGNWFKENWAIPSSKITFFHLKGIMENILQESGVKDSQSFEVKKEGFLNCLEVRIRGKEAGYLGTLSPKLLKYLDIKEEVFAGFLELRSLEKSLMADTHYQAISKYPGISRDLSLQLPEKIKYADLKDEISKQDRKLIRDITIFDVYEGEKIRAGYKSYAIRMIFRDDEKTLKDKQVDKLMEKIIVTLENKYSSEVRK